MSAHSARVVPFPDNDVGGEIRSGTDALRASVVILVEGYVARCRRKIRMRDEKVVPARCI